MAVRVSRWLVVILGVVLVARTSANVYRLWKAGERVKEAEARLERVRSDNERLKKELAEAKTPEYQEKLAREKLGYGYPGEVVLVLPEQDSTQGQVLSAQEEQIPNWVRWRKLYFKF